MRKTSKELRESRAGLAPGIEKLAAVTHGDEGRSLTADEGKLWERMNKEYDDLTEAIKRAEIHERGESVRDEQGRIVNNPHGVGLEDRNGRKGELGPNDYVDRMSEATRGYKGEVWYDGATGKVIRCYGPNESVSAEHSDICIGRIACAKVFGQRSYLRDPELRALEGNLDLAGGDFLGTPVSAQIIDLARSRSVAIAAGLVTVVMGDRELSLVKVDGDATAQWLEENVAATQSQQTFGRAVLRAKTLRAHVPISEEILQDAPNAAVKIKAILREMLGLALDKAILTGGTAGTGGPIGLRNLTGVQEITSVAVPSYDDWSSAYENPDQERARRFDQCDPSPSRPRGD